MINISNNKALTLVEILASMLVLTIAVAASYTVAVSVVRNTTFAKNEKEVMDELLGWEYEVRATKTYEETGAVLSTWKKINAADSILQQDYTLLPLNSKVDNLEVEYKVESIDLGTAAYPFYDIRTRARWDERK